MHGKKHTKGVNHPDTPQTVGKHFAAQSGGVSKDSKRSVKHVAPDPGAASKMPTKHLPSKASMPYAHEKQGVHKTGC